MATDKNEIAIIEEEKIQLRELGHEIKTLLPGGDKLTDNQAIAVAKYSRLTRANSFRGEIWGYRDKNGNLVLVDGYKLLVRWAKKISDYSDKYEPLAKGEEGLLDGDIGYRCYILRYDRKSELSFYIQAGASFTEAYNLVATQAVGVVPKKEATYDPPKGWTWDQVARKRALKNALNLAYPMPSVDELMSDSWQVGDTETIEADWSESESYRTSGEKERAAQLNAWNRESQEHWDAMTEGEQATKVESNVDAMRGTNGDDDDPLELSPEDDPGIWLPDFDDFKETCQFEFRLSWPDLERILSKNCGYNLDQYDPVEAVEMYQAVGSYLASNGPRKAKPQATAPTGEPGQTSLLADAPAPYPD